MFELLLFIWWVGVDVVLIYWVIEVVCWFCG